MGKFSILGKKIKIFHTFPGWNYCRRAALFALLLQSEQMPSLSFQGIPRLSPPLPALTWMSPGWHPGAPGSAELPAMHWLHFSAPSHSVLTLLCCLLCPACRIVHHPILCVRAQHGPDSQLPISAAHTDLMDEIVKEEWFRSAPLRSWAALPIQPSWAAWGHEEKIQSKEGGKEGKEQAEHEEWKQQQLSTSQPSLPQQLDTEFF